VNKFPDWTNNFSR